MKPQELAEECRTAAALYSIGALAPDEAQRFEQRLESGCPFCISEVAAFTEAATYFGTSIPLHDPPAILRQRLLDRVIASSAPSSTLAAPDAADAHILVRAGESPWTPTPVSGVQVRPLLGDRTVLIRMDPGAAYPAHEHSNNEQCYVVEGTLTDADGFTIYPGDFICMLAGSTHKPIYSDQGCVLLVTYTA